MAINPPIRVDRILSRRRGDYRQDLPASPENAATAWTAYCEARDLDAGQVTAALGPTAAVAVDPGTHTVYVANGSDGTMSVVGLDKRFDRAMPVLSFLAWKHD